MENKTPPMCCGQEAEYIVQSISLAYYFCRTCKQEPKEEVEALAARYGLGDGVYVPAPLLHASPLSVALKDGGHSFTTIKVTTRCITCGTSVKDYANYGITCAQAQSMCIVPITNSAPPVNTPAQGVGNLSWRPLGYNTNGSIFTWECMKCGVNTCTSGLYDTPTACATCAALAPGTLITSTPPPNQWHGQTCGATTVRPGPNSNFSCDGCGADRYYDIPGTPCQNPVSKAPCAAQKHSPPSII